MNQVCPEWLGLHFPARQSVKFRDLQSPGFSSPCSEVDLAGYVISISDREGWFFFLFPKFCLKLCVIGYNILRAQVWTNSKMYEINIVKTSTLTLTLTLTLGSHFWRSCPTIIFSKVETPAYTWLSCVISNVCWLEDKPSAPSKQRRRKTQ